MTALELLDSWPVPHAAAAVVSPSGVIATHGPVDRAFRLASVTKPLTARAAQVAIEEGVIELDTPAGPPGSTVRHLLAHTSGLAMQTPDALAAPGAPGPGVRVLQTACQSQAQDHAGHGDKPDPSS